MLLKIDMFSPYFHAKLGCDFLSLFSTHTTDPICIFLHLIYSFVPLLQRGVSSWCCTYIFLVFLLKGYLENTEKDRIKRLIRLKPPTEFWMRNSEAVIIESAVWVVWWASCDIEWHVTKARQTSLYDISFSRMVQARILLGP